MLLARDLGLLNSPDYEQLAEKVTEVRTSDHFGGIVYQASDPPWERFAPGQESTWQSAQMGV